MKSTSCALLVLLTFLFPFFLRAQQSREGWHIGAGIGGAYYTSHWYYHRADGNPRYDNYPAHSLKRTVLLLNIEKQSIARPGGPISKTAGERAPHFDLDAGGELLLGFRGQTKAEWIAGDPVVSSGGLSAGIHGYVKGLMMLQSSKTMTLAPFVSLGPQIMMIHNNGKDLGQSASAAYYSYKDGWNEYLANMVLGLGIELGFPSVSIVPELRLGLIGIGSSSWYPNGDGVSRDGSPGFWGLDLKIVKKR